MQVHVTIKNALTGQIIRDNKVITEDFSWDQMGKFHDMFEKVYPDCHVNFQWKDSFIAGMPLNMAKDQEALVALKLDWEDYMAKWYPKAKLLPSLGWLPDNGYYPS